MLRLALVKRNCKVSCEESEVSAVDCKDHSTTVLKMPLFGCAVARNVAASKMVLCDEIFFLGAVKGVDFIPWLQSHQ